MSAALKGVVARHSHALWRRDGGVPHGREISAGTPACMICTDLSTPGFLGRRGGLLRCGGAKKLVGLIARASTGHTLGLLLSVLCCTTRSNCLVQFAHAGGVEVLAKLVGALSAQEAGAADAHARLLASLALAERVQLLLWILDILFRLPVDVETLRRSKAGEVIVKLSRDTAGMGAIPQSGCARIKCRAAAIKSKWLRFVNAVAVCRTRKRKLGCR